MTTSQPKAAVSFQEYVRFLSRYLKHRMGLVLALALFLLTNIGLQIYNPQNIRTFIDRAQAGGSIDELSGLALLFIGISIASQLVNVVVVFITENLGWGATNELRYDLARFCLGLDMSFHAGKTPGEMIERIDGDVMALSNFFSQFILQVFGNGLLVAGILMVLVREDWRISLALTFFVCLTIAMLLRLANIATASWEAERQSSATLYGFLEERLSGTEDIRSNNAKNYVLDRFYRLTRDLMKKTISAGLRMNVMLNTTWIMFAVGTAVSFMVGGALYLSGAISIGTVFMVVYYTGMLNWPIDRITQQMSDLQRASASLIRIIGIYRTQGKIPGEDQFEQPAELKLPPGALQVQFENVTFGYDDSQKKVEETKDGHAETEEAKGSEKEWVLQDISFCLQPGRVIGLLGRTGSGKTTLTRLLFRLYDIDTGCIRIGDEDIRTLPVRELRRRVGMVTQNIQLFNATVRENLTFFDATIPDERIHEAIRDLELEDWFEKLPKGLDTELASGGTGLSAGEAQLLAFTRIFLRDPGIIILDEATSRLDPATEYLIERAVDKLVRGRTAVIVAHRLGTVQRADDILILENGQVIEYGPRAVLADDAQTHFHQLLQTGMEEVLA